MSHDANVNTGFLPDPEKAREKRDAVIVEKFLAFKEELGGVRGAASRVIEELNLNRRLVYRVINRAFPGIFEEKRPQVPETDTAA